MARPAWSVATQDSVSASSGGLGSRPPGHGAEAPGLPRLLAGQPGLIRPPDVIDQAGLLGQPDCPGGGFDLAPQDSVARAGRVSMVQVVPGLSERQDRQPRDVPGLVPYLELLRSEGVADRVDRPGDVVPERDPHQGGPEERGHGALPRHGPQPADERRRQQGYGDQPGKPPG